MSLMTKIFGEDWYTRVMRLLSRGKKKETNYVQIFNTPFDFKNAKFFAGDDDSTYWGDVEEKEDGEVILKVTGGGKHKPPLVNPDHWDHYNG